MKTFVCAVALIAATGWTAVCRADEKPAAAAAGDEDMDLPGIGEPAGGTNTSAKAVSDPLAPMNRVFYHFNDKLYFWLLKPVAKGYSYVMPKPIGVGINNMFTNLRTPIRFGNCLLQGEFKGSWTELERLVINSTVGVLGFGDPAKDWWQIKQHDADFGQTLGRYGCGTSIYFVWPVIGPSDVRDTVGYAGDVCLDPLTYIFWDYWYWDFSCRAYETVNSTSLRLGDYEKFKDASIDPYVAMRDAYLQYRKNFIENKDEGAQPVNPLKAH